VNGVGELRLVHRRREPRLALGKERRDVRQRERRGRAGRPRKLGERHPDPDGGAVVGAIERRCVVLLDHRVGDHEQSMAQVVEHEQRIREQEHRVGQPQIILSGPRQTLHVMDHVVGEKTDGAALEPR
jgi:hypothetical protein